MSKSALTISSLETLRASHGLGATAIIALSLVRDGGKKRVDLAKEIGVSTASVTGMIDSLTDKGLVSEMSVEGDRRARFVVLTAKGVQLTNKHLFTSRRKMGAAA